MTKQEKDHIVKCLKELFDRESLFYRFTEEEPYLLQHKIKMDVYEGLIDIFGGLEDE